MADHKATEESTRPLALWESLAEEFIAGGYTLSDDFKKVEACYLSAPTDHGRMELEDALFQEFHREKRTALCISGGGVRSATFGLGVIQGLASAGREFRCAATDEPKSPLTEFDFLSTVSGGGYVGGWLSAWAAREPGGLQAVVKQLAPERAQSDLDPEPDALRHLRKYCRFLNPKMGILSADTWALVSTVLRNMMLNWLVLIPLLMAVLTIPVWYESLVKHFVPDIWAALTLWIGAGCALIATTYVGLSIPSLNRDGKTKWLRGTETEFVVWALAPFTLSALFLTLHWAVIEGNYSRREFAIFGAAVYATGSLIAAVFHWLKGRTRWWVGLSGVAVSAIAGFGAGLVAYPISQGFMYTDWSHPGLYCCLAVPLVLLTYQVAAVLAVGATSKISGDDDREWWARSAGWVLIVMVVWVVFCSAVILAPPLLQDAVSRIIAAATTAGVGGVASWLGKSAKTLSGLQTPKGEDGKPKISVTDIIAKLSAPLFLLMLIGVLAMANQSLIQMLPSLFQWMTALPMMGQFVVRLDMPALGEFGCAVAYGAVLFLVALGCSWLININRFSLHAMYRSRLVRTYLGASQKNRRANPFIDMDEHDNIDLVNLHKPGDPARPLHIVNMALNLVGGKNLAWQQRKAESFTASRLHTGCLRVGYQRTAGYAQHGELPSGANSGAQPGSFSLGSAMAISGAAASPNMGYHSSPLLSLVMTLFNARLGWWLANPGPIGKGQWQKDGPVMSFMPLINEALGRTNDESRWVYLSDGGHFENLGVYEMVLRRCRSIVVIDGSQDEKYTFEDLGNAVRKVRVDLGVSITFDKMPMHKCSDASNLYCAIGTIDYECVDGGEDGKGRILYIKACMNETEPIDVRHYASQYSAFPQQGTDELWFDESQFESYRRLGMHIVNEIVASGHTVGNTAVDQLFEAAGNYVGGGKPVAAKAATPAAR